MLKKQRHSIIFVLGLLNALGPFSTDMYLPAFPQIAKSLQTTEGSLSLSLSSYFFGIAIGQLFYGPLLDRFGRKKPLYIGLLIYIIGSFASILTHSLQELVIWRFITAAGGCVAAVVSLATVRDLFNADERPKVFSQLMLVLGVSPLVAPIAGSSVAVNIGWQAVFIILMIIAMVMLFLAAFVLPDVHPRDTSVILTPLPILKGYYQVFKNSQFYIFALSGSISFAALFSYIAASPIIFFRFFHLSAYHYCLIFTLLAAGFVGASQINILLLRRYHSVSILKTALLFQLLFSLLFLLVSLVPWHSLGVVIVLLFGMLMSIGMVLPNATMQALIPFSKNAGRASALVSTLQMLLATLSSSVVGCFYMKTMSPIGLIYLVLAIIAGLIFLLGKKKGH